MKIGIDLDGVLADFTTRFALMAHDKFGTPLGIEPCDWQWSNFGLTKEQIDALWTDIKATRNFWETLELEPGTNHRLLARLDKFHDVIYPTARVQTEGFSVTQQSAYWVKWQFSIEFPTVFVASDKELLAKAAQYDYFIDDRPKNCTAVKSVLPNCKVYLKNATHNMFYTPPFNIPRISGINDFCDLILGGGVN